MNNIWIGIMEKYEGINILHIKKFEGHINCEIYLTRVQYLRCFYTILDNMVVSSYRIVKKSTHT